MPRLIDQMQADGCEGKHRQSRGACRGGYAFNLDGTSPYLGLRRGFFLAQADQYTAFPWATDKLDADPLIHREGAAAGQAASRARPRACWRRRSRTHQVIPVYYERRRLVLGIHR